MAADLDQENRAPAARESFYRDISQRNLTPLWEVLAALVTPIPRTILSSAIWKFRQIKPDVLAAGRLISAEEAERRVLILENPAIRGSSAITHTLYAGLQLVLPGEVARAHRHSQSALRLVVDGEGAYTAVNGERRTMRRGDFIITPRWSWHDHGNLGKEPVVWLDGLDIPLVRALDASFAEHGKEAVQAELRPEGDSLARFGQNLVPIDYQPAPTEPARLFVYPFEQTKSALRGLIATSPDPHLGYKLRFVNPGNGQSPLPTIGAFAQLLPAGFSSRHYRCTDGTVYLCLNGEGEAEIEGQSFEFEENDIFVVPSWKSLRLHSRTETILFSYSDRPVQSALGLWREDRGE